MSYAIFETLALMVVLVASATYALKAVAPNAWGEWKKRVLIAALQPSRPEAVKRIARRFAPRPAFAMPTPACKACNGCEKAR